MHHLSNKAICRHHDLLCLAPNGHSVTSAKILRQENAAGPRRVTGDFTKDAPTKALVKTRRLEVDGIEYPCSTTTSLRFLLSECKHARADITPAHCFW